MGEEYEEVAFSSSVFCLIFFCLLPQESFAFKNQWFSSRFSGLSAAVNRARVQKILFLAVLSAACFAAWAWLRPYAWQVDPAARCKIEGVEISEDHGHYWVEVFLKMNADEGFDPTRAVKLKTTAARELAPADFHYAAQAGSERPRLKFWLESADLAGRLELRINDGMLVLKSNEGLPQIEHLGTRRFTTHHW